MKCPSEIQKLYDSLKAMGAVQTATDHPLAFRIHGPDGEDMLAPLDLQPIFDQLVKVMTDFRILQPRLTEKFNKLAERLGVKPLAEEESAEVMFVASNGNRYDLLDMINKVLDKCDQ